MPLQDLVRDKSELILALENAKRLSDGRRTIESLASEAATLESRIADLLLSEDRAEDAVVSLISAASCMSDAGRQLESRRLFAAAYSLTSLDSVRQWIAARVPDLPVQRLPADVFRTVPVHIVDNPRLRIPQREAYMAAHRHFDKRRDHAIIQLPVGCGKTGTMAVLPFDISRGRTLVVAPNLEIASTVAAQLDYTSPQSFYARTGVLSNGRGPSSAILDSAANVHDCDAADFVVTNIQQLVAANARKWLSRFPSDYFDMILVDEGHHNVAASWQLLFERFPRAKVTSFTATPIRSDGRRVEGHRIYRFPLSEAIREGYVRDLASRRLQPTELYFEYEGAKRQLTLQEVLELREQDWFSRGIALARECNEHIVDASIQCMLELRSGGTIRHQIVAAACSIDHAKAVRSLYAERGYRADVIHNDMKSEEQDRVRHDLRTGVLDAIVHVQMLGEGADYPTLGVAAIFRPYRHMVPYVQFIGRVMRVPKENSPGDPDNRAYVVSHVGLNVDRWWDELKQFDADDQLVFSELANSERAFQNEPTSAVGVGRRRFRPPMEVLQDVVERFVEVGFLEEDANALADDVIQALALRGVTFDTLGLSREQVVRRILDQRHQSEMREGSVQRSAVQPQRRRQEMRRRLDERVRSAAKELLTELDMSITGRDLLPLARKQRPSNNLAAAIILVNLQVQEFLKAGAAERDLLSPEELQRAHDAMDSIVDAVADRVRSQLRGSSDG